MNNNNSFAAYSAPISVVISGQAGERFGKPLLVCAVNRRVTCSIRKSKQRRMVSGRLLQIENSVKDYLRRKSIPFQLHPYEYHISSSKIAGIDSVDTSAFTVAATASFLTYLTGKEFTPNEINTLAYHIEKKENRAVIGYSTSASSFGGLLYIRREFEFLKTLSRLQFKFSSKLQNHLYIGLPANGKKNPDKSIDRLYSRSPKRAEEYLSLIEKNTRRLTVAIASENTELFLETLKSIQKVSGSKYAVPSQEAVVPISLEEKPALLFFIKSKKKIPGLAKKLNIKLFPFRLANIGLQKVTDS